MPKAWLAIFFGYQGTNFYGMQYQIEQHIRTVQYELIKMLRKRQFLLTENRVSLFKDYKWARAARTDKGVHALINGVSAWFNIPGQLYQEDHTLDSKQLTLLMKEMFQESELVFHSVKRVTPRFDMRQLIKARTYTYICPIRFFQAGKLSQEEVLEKINQCCQRFVGTHNFHNYSKGMLSKDPKAMRYILRFQCSNFEKGNVKFQIKGQSFIYHQIRKIVGAIIFIFLNGYEPDFLGNTFFRNQLDLPLAPPYGLYLTGLSFDSYNRKKDVIEPITFEEKSIDELAKQLEDVILEIDQGKWDQWFVRLKNGTLPKLDDSESEPHEED